MSASTVAETSLGRVEIEFGFNRWVMVTTRAGTEQAQIGSRDELAALLHRLGLVGGEPQELAREAWAARPQDASLPKAFPGETMMGATGLSKRTILAFVAAFVALVLFLSYYAASHWPEA